MHHQSTRTLLDVRTTLAPEAALAAATAFFAEQNGIYTAFLEKAGPGWATYRGQGGEEIAVAAQATADGFTRVSGSSYLFDAQVARFLSTLPPAPPEPVPAALSDGEPGEAAT
jgi:hypothetical protein